MTTKLGKMVTYLEGLLPIKLNDALIMWSSKITWKTKTIISPIPQCLWPPNLAGQYLERLPPMKLLDPLVTWPCKIMWQAIISSLPQRLWPPHLARLWLTLSHSFPWSSRLERPRDNLKPLYLHYHSAHGHQTCSVGDLPWWAPIT